MTKIDTIFLIVFMTIIFLLFLMLISSYSLGIALIIVIPFVVLIGCGFFSITRIK